MVIARILDKTPHPSRYAFRDADFGTVFLLQ